jgi:HD-GYP domain-containing protein (c-di-GMP phosphodiesterase class II)
MRVLAVADVYAALTVERPYRPAYSPHRALEIMQAEVPGRLDDDALAAVKTLVLDQAASANMRSPTGARPPDPGAG